MPRPPRLQLAGATYHITSRGNRRQQIFIDLRDRERFLALLASTVDRHSWRCLAYCLMPNHFHLVIETPGPDLAVGMHRLKNGYVQWFNRRHDLDGHLFQGRYHGVHVDNTVHLLELGRYLALNPVRSGLCRAPEDWPWSSYRAMIDLAPPGFLAVDETLSHFGADRERARARFRAFVLDGDTRVRAE